MIPLILIAVLTVSAATVALSLRNLIHSALLLIGSWVGIGCFYLWAGAEFVAFAQVLVYVGAVSMVVLFAVLLTRRHGTDHVLAPETRTRVAAGILVGAAMGALLIGAILSSPLPDSRGQVAPVAVRELGHLLAGPHAISLLIAGVILTVSLLGAIVIAATDKREDA